MRKEDIPQFKSEELKEAKKGDKYKTFETFFDRILSGCKRDLLTGALMRKVDHLWLPELNRLETIQSLAISEGLPHSQTKQHLKRYIETQKPQLLCDLPKWDGKDWIREATSKVHLKNVSNEILEDYFKFWGSNVFRRIKNPRHQNICLILKGNQGIGKDEFVRSMMQGLDPYFSKFRNAKDERDVLQQAIQNLVLNIEEFDQTSKYSVAFLKDLITSSIDEFRVPYEIAPRKFLNRCSYISTVNIDTLLRDTTGNRRFAIFDIEKINWDYPSDWSPQILAQMKELARAQYQLKPQSQRIMADIVDGYTPEDPADALIELWNERISNLSIHSGLNGGLRYEQVSPVIDDLARIFKWSFSTVRSLIRKRGGCRKTNKFSLYYMVHQGENGLNSGDCGGLVEVIPLKPPPQNFN